MVEEKTVKSVKGLRQVMDRKKGMFQRLLIREVKSQLKQGNVAKAYEAEVIKVLMEIQSTYFSGPVGNLDPTAMIPNQVGAVSAEVRKQLLKSAASLNEKNFNDFTLTVLSDSFLGISGAPSKSGPTAPIKWLVFFITSGPLGNNLYWVPTAAAKALGMQDSSPGGYGRFGEGFLITRTPKSAANANKRLKKMGVAAKILLHPQSGKTGNPALFDNVIKNVDFEEIVLKPAAQRAMKKLFKS